MSNPWEKPVPEHRYSPEEIKGPLRKRVGPWESAAASQEEYPLDMLRRLEGEDDDDSGVLEFSPYQRSASGEPLDEASCPACHSSNPRFHRYCGYCGASLDGTSAAATEDFSKVSELHAHPGSSVEQRAPRQASSREPEAEAEGLRSFSPAAPAAEAPNSQRDLSFLREQSFTSFDSPPRSRRRAWQYLAVLLLLGLAGFGYWKWTVARQNASAEQYLREQADVPQNSPDQSLTSQSAAQSRSQAASAPSQGQPAAPPSSKAAQAPTTTSTVSSGQSSPNPAATPRANGETARQAVTSASRREHDRAADREVSQKTARDLASPASASPAPTGGAEELATARHYLEGPNRNPSEAARWLWRAVSKQNSEASLLLANLYLRGDGVSRSCEQGRLLLVTAAKKGASGAASQLRNLESTGCQ